ncbi:MAG: T9SS type A sorting domain-containing protein [Bacteroidales bacterium]|nr:T9SS type A sorting domain-containing protein [Bacteroidales bacterium]
MLDLGSLSPGFHLLNIRVKDENENWSSVLIKAFYIDNHHGIASEINNIEYFIDEDPGYGDAIPYTDFNSGLQLNELFFANMGGLTPGNHVFSIRMKNEILEWSQTLNQEFELINCDLSISGTISDANSNTINDGFVVLYQSFGEGAALGVDTLLLSDGSYQFTAVCPNSHYFIKAFPENETIYMATYYGDSPYWQQASIISTEESDLNNIDIQIFEFSEMEAGSSQLGGHIYQAEFRGEPVKNIDIVLEMGDGTEKEDYLAVAADRSNEVGAWNITDLPNGSFRIKVEIPGLEMDTTYYVDITSGNTVVGNLDYYIDFTTGIFIDHFGIEEYNLSQSLNLFPNPASNGNFWIESYNKQVMIEEITIYQYSGQQLANYQLDTQNHQVDVSHLAKGFYIISIQTNKGIINRKIMIQ